MSWTVQRPSWPACATFGVMAIVAGSDRVTGSVRAIPDRGRDEWLFQRWAEMDDWIARSRAGGGRAAR